MPTAEELKARFENRVRPGPTDERLAASLGLIAATPEPLPTEKSAGETDTMESHTDPAVTNDTNPETQAAPDKPPRPNGKARRKAVRLVSPDETGDGPGPAANDQSDADTGQWGSGGEGLELIGELFPAPPLLAAAGPEPVKVGFPVPVDLIRDVTRLKVDLSRHLGRRLSNHEVGAAAARLVPAEPGEVAELVRHHAARLGVGELAIPRRRLVAAIPQPAATRLEDLVLAVDETENVRVTKSQLWALGHLLLLERVGR